MESTMKKLFYYAIFGGMFLAMPLTAVAQGQGQFGGQTQYRQEQSSPQKSKAVRRSQENTKGCTRAQKMSGAPCL
jgi:hypothetical protein